MLFTPSKDGRVSVAQVLVPVSLIAFIIFIMLAFQTSQVLREREALHQSLSRQDKPLEEVQKVQTQLDALAVGTKKLADKGDKNAEAIIANMKKIGITVNDKSNAPAPATAPAAAPAAPAADESKE